MGWKNFYKKIVQLYKLIKVQSNLDWTFFVKIISCNTQNTMYNNM